MKLFGLLLLLLGAFFVSREYSRYMRKRLAECEGFLSFIKYMRRQVHCFLRSPSEIGRDFEGEAIAPFLSELRREESLSSAYLSSVESFSLSREEREVLSELFTSIGSCYADEGVRLLDVALERLSELHGELSEGSKKNTRLVATLSSAFAVGVFILVI